MEGKGLKTISGMVVFVMLLLSEGATAEIDKLCFDVCLASCVDLPDNCIKKCRRDCSSPAALADGILYDCNLRCSLDLCTKFIHDAKKAGSCMYDCSSKYCSTSS